MPPHQTLGRKTLAELSIGDCFIGRNLTAYLCLDATARTVFLINTEQEIRGTCMPFAFPRKGQTVFVLILQKEYSTRVDNLRNHGREVL